MVGVFLNAKKYQYKILWVLPQNRYPHLPGTCICTSLALGGCKVKSLKKQTVHHVLDIKQDKFMPPVPVLQEREYAICCF